MSQTEKNVPLPRQRVPILVDNIKSPYTHNKPKKGNVHYYFYFVCSPKRERAAHYYHYLDIIFIALDREMFSPNWIILFSFFRIEKKKTKTKRRKSTFRVVSYLVPLTRILMQRMCGLFHRERFVGQHQI